MSDGTLNLPVRLTPPSPPSAGRQKIWIDGNDGKPKSTDENGVSKSFESVYGQNYFYAANEVEETNNTTTFEESVSLNFSGIDPASTARYEIMVSFVWGYSAPNRDYTGRFTLNGVQFGDVFKKEPKDGGADQRQWETIFVGDFSAAELGGVSGSVGFEYAAQQAGDKARPY
jgi:hypothetical protein